MFDVFSSIVHTLSTDFTYYNRDEKLAKVQSELGSKIQREQADREELERIRQVGLNSCGMGALYKWLIIHTKCIF